MSSQGHLLIQQNAYMGIEGTFFAIAIIVSIIRTIIRFHMWRRLSVDDYFFFLAVASLIISNALFFNVAPKIYFAATASEEVLFLEATKLLAEIKEITVKSNLAEAFAWITIFSVKFSFLFYFRTLISKIQTVQLLWWCTLVVLVPVAISVTLGPAIVCPYTGNEVLAHCTLGNQFLHREKIMLYYGVIVDILTDAMVISIPIYLLHKTQFKITQKVNIGIVLCLSFVMITISMVRGISAHIHGTSDQTWAQFWVQLETSISVTMVCMTAFRTLFTASKKSSQNKISPGAPRYEGETPPTFKARLFKKQAKFLPDVEPGATLTGMRTMIRDNGKTTQGSFEMSDISEGSLTRTRTFEGSVGQDGVLIAEHQSDYK